LRDAPADVPRLRWQHQGAARRRGLLLALGKRRQAAAAYESRAATDFALGGSLSVAGAARFGDSDCTQRLIREVAPTWRFWRVVRVVAIVVGVVEVSDYLDARAFRQQRRALEIISRLPVELIAARPEQYFFRAVGPIRGRLHRRDERVDCRTQRHRLDIFLCSEAHLYRMHRRACRNQRI